MERNITKLYGLEMERSQKQVSGKIYNDYFVKREVFGGESKSNFGPPKANDIMTYKEADIVFAESSKAELVIDEPDKGTNGQTHYYAISTRLYRGIPIEVRCELKPIKPSDRTALLNMIELCKADLAADAEAEEQEQATAREAGAEQQAMELDSTLPEQEESDKPKAKTKKE